MLLTTDGLIIKEQKLQEDTKLLTILTRDNGVIRAFVQGARKIKGKNCSSTQLLCYSRFVLYCGREKYIVNEAETVELFFGIRSDITKLMLAEYFCELCLCFIPAAVESPDYLRLMLNGLHMLEKDKRPSRLIKAIVELRLLTLAGFMPDVVMCRECGQYEPDVTAFLIKGGTMLCRDCYERTQPQGEIVVFAPAGVLKAVRHIVLSPFEQIFSFMLPQDAIEILCDYSEKYLLACANHSFKTLEFYNTIKD